MGFRFRKSIKLGGGFRINLSKSGIGYSWGVPGYRITKTATGRTRHTYSIPEQVYLIFKKAIPVLREKIIYQKKK